MIIIKNKIIPFKGFLCVNILGILFVREEDEKMVKYSQVYCHEGIHTYQQYEIITASAIISLLLCNIFQSWWYMLGVVAMPFTLYILGFILEMVIPPYHNVKKTMGLWKKIRKVWHDAYKDNCFEREAYQNEWTDNYLAVRSPFAWVKYIIPRNERRRKN